jgi:hypothetical protein
MEIAVAFYGNNAMMTYIIKRKAWLRRMIVNFGGWKR